MDSKLFVDLLLECDEYLLDIHTAANIGCDERVRDIIENSESRGIVDDQNKNGWAPLMYGACCANLQVVHLLLEEGAETDLKNNDGHTALILASKCGSGDVVSLLIDSGAKINSKDLRGWTALFYAAAFGHRSVVQLLIERGATANLVDDEERITPLMLAAAAGHEIIVRDLLQIGVNVNEESASGDTARSFALKNGHIDVKNLIDAHCFTKKSQTPNIRYPDLFSLLKKLHLSKYYHIFENQDIDQTTFWLLTDDDLKEIGIQLLGPRKKMCMAISQYHREHSLNSYPRSALNAENNHVQNKQLYQVIEKERTLRIKADQNLVCCFQSVKNYFDSVQTSVGSAVSCAEKLKDSHEYLKTVLHGALRNGNYGANSYDPKLDLIMKCLECIRKLIDSHHQHLINLQRIECPKLPNK